MIAEEIEGFGGLFYDRGGQLVVYLKDPSSGKSKSISAVAFPILGIESSDVTAGPEIRSGNYDSIELLAFRRRFSESLPEGLFSMIDIDESRNMLRLGISTEDYRQEAENYLASIGLPRQSWRVVLRSRAGYRIGDSRSGANLLDKSVRQACSTGLPPPFAGDPLQLGCGEMRPIRGGQKYVRSLDADCTVGLNGRSGSLFGIISASHCSSNEGGVDGSDVTLDVTVADETEDTSWRFPSGGGSKAFALGCSVAGQSPFKCRDADANFSLYRESVSAEDIQFGKIHRTGDPKSGSAGNDDIVGTFTITAEASSHLVGTVVNKVGYKTGWTYGAITGTNVAFESGLITNAWYLDQVEAVVYSDKGDSGSPVFRRPNLSNENVTIFGILWGGPVDANDNVIPDTSYYSPISTVMRDTNVNAVF